MEDAKADLAKLAARVSSQVALLRDRLASDQNTAQEASAVETSNSLEPSAQAKRELREVANKLALRGLALKGVVDRLESQQKTLEAAGNASAKQLARLRQSFTNTIRRAQAASKRMSMAPSCRQCTIQSCTVGSGEY